MSDLLYDKAGFKALMDECGFTRLELADWLGVDVSTVGRWLAPAARQTAPDGVWERLRLLLEERGALVSRTVGGAEAGKAQTVFYARRPEDLPDGMAVPLGVFNASARAVGQALEAAGFAVDYVYLPDGAAGRLGRPNGRRKVKDGDR